MVIFKNKQMSNYNSFSAINVCNKGNVFPWIMPACFNYQNSFVKSILQASLNTWSITYWYFKYYEYLQWLMSNPSSAKYCRNSSSSSGTTVGGVTWYRRRGEFWWGGVSDLLPGVSIKMACLGEAENKIFHRFKIIFYIIFIKRL